MPSAKLPKCMENELKKKITMANPTFSAEDKEYILKEMDAILDGALSMGPHVKRFEEEFASRVGVDYAVAVNACTSALEIALDYFDVAGKEVIVPAQTFVATGVAVQLAGGIPVFAEISPHTFCLDLDDVKARVNENTAGIILVHMAGLVVPNVLDFRSFCDERDIFLIEDAAHSPGARIDRQEAGSFGHAACFSFYPTKVMTAGEGGMLTTNDGRIHEFARSMQQRGRDLNHDQELYIRPGRNVRMTEPSALIGRVQLSHLDEMLQRRRHIGGIYKRELQTIPELQLLLPEVETQSSHWKIPVLLSRSVNRELLKNYLSEHGISIDFAYHPPLHLQPVFKNQQSNSQVALPISEDLLARHICLPCHPGLQDDEITYVCRTLIKGITKGTN